MNPPVSPAQLAARVIPAIGRPDFPERLRSVCRELSGCEIGGPLDLEAVQRIEQAGPILVAAIRRHMELLEQATRTVVSPSLDTVLQWARERGLSEREAEVAAGLATGRSQSDIARRFGLSLNSVITYRRRAYQKLGVADRRQLQALCARQLSLEDELPPGWHAQPAEPWLPGSVPRPPTHRTCASTPES
jgi:DNA-binding CsgD family transcriptional regulator